MPHAHTCVLPQSGVTALEGTVSSSEAIDPGSTPGTRTIYILDFISRLRLNLWNL